MGEIVYFRNNAGCREAFLVQEICHVREIPRGIGHPALVEIETIRGKSVVVDCTFEAVMRAWTGKVDEVPPVG